MAKRFTINSDIYSSASIPNLDGKYGPYESVEEAFEMLGPDEDDVLAVGLTVGIQEDPDGPIVEYWFKDACESASDLVPKGNSESGAVIDPDYVHTDNNFTTALKTKLEGLENYDDTLIRSELEDKVDKVPGKGLSTNDYSTVEKNKLGTIEEGAQENIIEEVQVNGTALVPDNDKAVNVLIPEYTIDEVATTAGYYKTYQLKKDNTYVGTKINIPKDLVIESGSVETVVTPDVPYEGAVPGDKYIDLVLNDPNEDHIYIPVKDLVDIYTAGDGIDIDNNNVISVTLKSGSTNGLAVDSNGISLALATTSTPGAMSAADKTKLDGIEAGAQVNVNADWDASSGDAEILNKPTTIAGYGITDAYTKTETDTLLDDKVDKVEGKQLSTEDFTTELKTKLEGVAEGADVNVIETVKVNGTALTPDANKAVDVTVPTAVSDLTNDLNFIDNTVNDLVNYTTTTDMNAELAKKQDIIQYVTLPEPTQEDLGKIAQYIGTTTIDYTNGYFYQVVSSGGVTPTYSWENITVQEVKGEASDISYNNMTSGLAATNVQSAIDELAYEKVDKVSGKQLSTEDYTTAEKTKLDGIEDGAEVNTVETIKVNGTALTPDQDRAVDITIAGDADDITYDNSTSGLTATNVQDALDEVVGDIPTAVSDLTNDLNFIDNTVNNLVNYTTTTDMNTELAKKQDVMQFTTLPNASHDNIGMIAQYTGNTTSSLTNGYFYQVQSSGGATPTYTWVNIPVQDVPTALSELTNDTGFIDNTVNDLVNYTTTTDLNTALDDKADVATTLAGYGITDAYTKTEVDNKVASVYRFKGSVVLYSDLPTTGQEVGDVYNVQDADIPHHIKAGDNVAWTGTSWDVLGGEIDLSSYYTKTEADTLLDAKVDKVTGKQLSTEDYTTAEQTKLSGIETGAEVNTIETVKVNGTPLVPDANRAVDITVAGTASNISYDNTTSGLTADDVQEAVDEIVTDLADKVNEPASEGTDGQVLTTDGQGGRTWANAVSAIKDLSDVNLDTATLADGQILRYNETDDEWNNVDLDIDIATPTTNGLVHPDDDTIHIDNTGEISVDENYKKIFIGTHADWDNLTTEEKIVYDEAHFTDDQDLTAVTDEITEGDMRAVTSNAVAKQFQINPNPNLLINPWFNALTSDTIYQWNMNYSATLKLPVTTGWYTTYGTGTDVDSIVTFKIDGELIGAKFAPNVTDSRPGQMYLYQVFDDTLTDTLLGKTVTASALLDDGTIIKDTFTFAVTENPGGMIRQPKHQVNDAPTYVTFGIGNFTNKSVPHVAKAAFYLQAEGETGSTNTAEVIIRAVKLELGNKSTLIYDTIPNPALETEREYPAMRKHYYIIPANDSLEIFIPNRLPYFVSVSGTNGGFFGLWAGIGYGEAAIRNQINKLTDGTPPFTITPSSSQYGIVITSTASYDSVCYVIY